MGSDVGLNPRFGWLKAFSVEGLGPIIAARMIVITATINNNIIIIVIVIIISIIIVIIIIIIIVIIAIRLLLLSGPLSLPDLLALLFVFFCCN